MTDRTGSQIDHVNIAVPDLQRSLAFYTPTLATLGIGTTLAVPADASRQGPAMHGFGWGHKPFFWLIADGVVGENMHVAFTAPDRATVRAFYDAALAAGGTSLHAPAIWAEYHADYYGGFVLDPDGINVEAVCHHPE